MDKVSDKTVSTNHNLFEEKGPGEPKRYRTEVLPLASLTPYRQAKPAHLGAQHGSKLFLAQWVSDSLPPTKDFSAFAPAWPWMKVQASGDALGPPAHHTTQWRCPVNTDGV